MPTNVILAHSKLDSKRRNRNFIIQFPFGFWVHNWSVKQFFCNFFFKKWCIYHLFFVCHSRTPAPFDEEKNIGKLCFIHLLTFQFFIFFLINTFVCVHWVCFCFVLLRIRKLCRICADNLFVDHFWIVNCIFFCLVWATCVFLMKKRTW